LIDVYEELGLRPENFKRLSRNTWSDPATRKKIFNKFAHRKGFDPSQASPWYKVALNDIKQIKGGISVLMYHQGSHIKALIDLFPELHLQEDKFVPHPLYKNKKSIFRERPI